MDSKREMQAMNVEQGLSADLVRRTIRSYEEILRVFFSKCEFHCIFDEKNPLEMHDSGEDIVTR